MNGFLMMMTQNGKLLYISDNAAEYLGHSMASSFLSSLKEKKNDYYYLHFVFYFDGVVIPLSISSMSLVSQVLKCVFGGGVGSLWKTVFDRNERQKWLERPVIGRHGGINGAKRVPISVLSVCIYYTTSLKEKKKKNFGFYFFYFSLILLKMIMFFFFLSLCVLPLE